MGGGTILKLSQLEWRQVVASVVMPFFLSSPQLLDAEMPDPFHALGWHREGHATVPELRTGAGYPTSWLERSGLVRLDGRGGKKRKELMSACVFPAVCRKIDFSANERGVGYKVVGGKKLQNEQRSGHFLLSFTVRAVVVARPGGVGPE